MKWCRISSIHRINHPFFGPRGTQGTATTIQNLLRNGEIPRGPSHHGAAAKHRPFERARGVRHRWWPFGAWLLPALM